MSSELHVDEPEDNVELELERVESGVTGWPMVSSSARDRVETVGTGGIGTGCAVSDLRPLILPRANAFFSLLFSLTGVAGAVARKESTTSFCWVGDGLVSSPIERLRFLPSCLSDFSVSSVAIGGWDKGLGLSSPSDFCFLTVCGLDLVGASSSSSSPDDVLACGSGIGSTYFHKASSGWSKNVLRP